VIRRNPKPLVKIFSCIKTQQSLEKSRTDLKNIADVTNARIYINLAGVNLKKATWEITKEALQKVENETWHSIKGIENHAYGSCPLNRFFLVDLDGQYAEPDYVNNVVTVLNGFRPLGEKLVVKVPTLNGIHLITHPFDKSQFDKHFGKTHDLHTNNPTLLYAKQNIIDTISNNTSEECPSYITAITGNLEDHKKYYGLH